MWKLHLLFYCSFEWTHNSDYNLIYFEKLTLHLYICCAIFHLLQMDSSQHIFFIELLPLLFKAIVMGYLLIPLLYWT